MIHSQQNHIRYLCFFISFGTVVFVSLLLRTSLYPSSSKTSASTPTTSIIHTRDFISQYNHQQEQTQLDNTNSILAQHQYNDDAIDSFHSQWEKSVDLESPLSSKPSLTSMLSSLSINSQNLRRSTQGNIQRESQMGDNLIHSEQIIVGSHEPTTRQRQRRTQGTEEGKPSILDFLTSEQSNSTAAGTINVATTNRTLNPYHKITSGANGALGIRNYNVTNGNPLKGLVLNPSNTPGFRPTDDIMQHPYNGTKRIEHSLEAWYIGLDMVQTHFDKFNWTSFDERLDDSWERGCHSIPRVIIDYPGEPLHIPPFLLEDGNKVELRQIDRNEYGTSLTPIYTDTNLLRAIENFIKEFGRLYDNDQRIAYIQMGIVGFWGEWHTNGQENLFNETVTDNVLRWYNESFEKTPIQGRYPTRDIYNTQKMGYHDDSFTHSTLDGKYNGGFNESYFFMSQIIETNQSDFWKFGPMGGEVRPKTMRLIHDPNEFPTNTRNHQDFLSCIYETHATYIRNSFSFSYNETELSDAEVVNARYASSRMGYSFQITEIETSEALVTETNRVPKQVNSSSWIWQSNLVDVTVTIQQVGIAPFYYPLTMRLFCNNQAFSATGSTGRNLRRRLVDQFQSTKVLFRNIPATNDCLGKGVLVRLESYMLHPLNPIKFAQGTTGNVKFTVPLPPIRNFESGQQKPPTKQPSSSPTKRPTSTPNSSPSSTPDVPTETPSIAPSSAVAIPFVLNAQASTTVNEKSNIKIMLIDTNKGKELGLLINNHHISYELINTHNLTIRADIENTIDDISVAFLWTDKDGTGQVYDDIRDDNRNSKKYVLGPTTTINGGMNIVYTPLKYFSYEGHKRITIVVTKVHDNDISPETSLIGNTPGDIIAHRTIDFSFW
jgi:hypothetical protein